MMSKIKVLLFVIPFLSVAVSAEVVQFSICTLNEGKTMADAQAWMEDWRKIKKQANKQYELQLFNPNAGDDTLLPGKQFGMLGTTPTLTSYGDGWDWWYSSTATMKSREMLGTIAACGANSIWVSTD